MIKNVVSLASSNGKVMPSLRVVVHDLIENSDQMRFDLGTIRDLRVVGRQTGKSFDKEIIERLSTYKFTQAQKGEVLLACTEMEQTPERDELMTKMLAEFDPTAIRPDQTIEMIYKIQSNSSDDQMKKDFIEKLLTVNILDEATNQMGRMQGNLQFDLMCAMCHRNLPEGDWMRKNVIPIVRERILADPVSKTSLQATIRYN